MIVGLYRDSLLRLVFSLADLAINCFILSLLKQIHFVEKVFWKKEVLEYDKYLIEMSKSRCFSYYKTFHLFV